MSEYFFGVPVAAASAAKVSEWLAAHFPSVTLTRDAFGEYVFTVSQTIGGTDFRDALEQAIMTQIPCDLVEKKN